MVCPSSPVNIPFRSVAERHTNNHARAATGGFLHAPCAAFDVTTDPRAPSLHKVVEPEEIQVRWAVQGIGPVFGPVPGWPAPCS